MTMQEDIERLFSPDEIVIPCDLKVFDGHFPGNPIVPGIYAVELALSCITHHLGCEIQLIEIVRSKFRKTMTPGMVLFWTIKICENHARVVFIDQCDNKRAAEMELVVEKIP